MFIIVIVFADGQYDTFERDSLTRALKAVEVNTGGDTEILSVNITYIERSPE